MRHFLSSEGVPEHGDETSCQDCPTRGSVKVNTIITSNMREAIGFVDVISGPLTDVMAAKDNLVLVLALAP